MIEVKQRYQSYVHRRNIQNKRETKPLKIDKEGGKIILPLGRKFQTQNLVLGVKEGGAIKKEGLIPVRFVPMTGKIKDN